MDNAYKIPAVVILQKEKSQAAPIHPFILGIETGKIILDNHGTGIKFLGIIQRVAFSQAMIKGYLWGGGKIYIIDELVIILHKGQFDRRSRTVIVSPGVYGAISE
jgi:hypothetical protein